MPDAFGNPTLEEINAAAAAQEADPAWLATQMYYPVSVFGNRMWVPVPPGARMPASAQPRGQIPAGEDIRDRGMETVAGGAQGTTAAPPGAGSLVPAETSIQAATQGATARAKASQLLYGAMRGLPFMSQGYLGALEAGQTPAPRTMTPRTLAALAGDQFLSDSFFSLLEAAGLYPTSFLSEVGRFQPRGMNVAPSFF